MRKDWGRALKWGGGQLLQLPRRAKAVLQLSSDAFGVAVAVFIAGLLHDGVETFNAAFAAILIAGVTVWLLSLAGVYKAWLRYLSPNIGWMIGVLGVAMSGLAAVLYRATYGVWASVSDIVYLAALLLVALSIPRLFARTLLGLVTAARRERVVIYGAGASGRELAAALKVGRKFTVCAFLDDDHAKTGSTVMGIPVYGPSALGRVINEGEVTRILLAMPRISVARRQKIVDSLTDLQLQIQTVPRFSDLASGESSVDQLRNLDVQDLLEREVVPPIPELIEHDVRSRAVLVTGAGGSIGSEIARQVLAQSPSRLVLLDHSEPSLYQIERELLQRDASSHVAVVPVLGSVCDERLLQSVLRTHEIETVYHAAAYKHVPMVESNVLAGISNNVFGSWRCAKLSAEEGVESFVLVSTDKAVRPTNVMGASKRLAELGVQALAKVHSRTRFSIVRFGNVLNSSGSVVPLFREQIASGGPVTVTHRDVIRYFMTIPEAAQLVVQAGAQGRNAEVFVLDMGAPVRILELAQKMIRLSGKSPRIHGEKAGANDIRIELSGLRSGEKLYEELLVHGAEEPTKHPRILRADEPSVSLAEYEGWLREFEECIATSDARKARRILLRMPLYYSPTSYETRAAIEREEEGVRRMDALN